MSLPVKPTTDDVLDHIANLILLDYRHYNYEDHYPRNHFLHAHTREDIVRLIQKHAALFEIKPNT